MAETPDDLGAAKETYNTAETSFTEAETSFNESKTAFDADPENADLKTAFTEQEAQRLLLMILRQVPRKAIGLKTGKNGMSIS